MKANELMIGDWFRRSIYQVVIDFQITQISKNGESLYVYGPKGNIGRVDQIETIPLTPEILEKNGFELRQGVWILAEELWRIYIQYKDGKWSIDVRSEISSKDKKGRADLVSFCRDWAENFFVHELQHALRLCGIKKEIVL